MNDNSGNQQTQPEVQTSQTNPSVPVQGQMPIPTQNQSSTPPVRSPAEPIARTKNPLDVFVGAFRWWLNGLLGKKRETGESLTQTPVAEPEKQKSPLIEEDSVLHDVNAVKEVAEKITHVIQEKATPLIQKGLEETTQVVETSTSIAKGNKTKRIIQIVGIGVFVLVALFISIQIVRRFIGKESTPPTTQTGSPTPGPAVEEIPSIYANDPNLKSLEETIGVLENEARNTSIREPNLNVPALDFAINFK